MQACLTSDLEDGGELKIRVHKGPEEAVSNQKERKVGTFWQLVLVLDPDVKPNQHGIHHWELIHHLHGKQKGSVKQRGPYLAFKGEDEEEG